MEDCLLYVFSRTGQRVESFRSSDGRFDFFLTDETYDFLVVANKADLPADLETKSELLSRETLFSENRAGHFVMAGVLDNHVIEADEKLTVEVRRLAAKVSCTLRTAFTGSLATEPFVVEDMFLTNVPGRNVLGLTDSMPAAGAPWYNPAMWNGTLDAPLDLLAAHVEVPMKAVDILADGPSFYTYPNYSPDSHDKDKWEPRCTRFVVRASLAGHTTYYPVTLERVSANRHYHIDLTVSNYGVDHPEDRPGDYAGLAISISVAEWEGGPSLNGDY